jgi:hypothetical protein
MKNRVCLPPAEKYDAVRALAVCMVAVDVVTAVVSGAVRGCVEEGWQQQVEGLSKKGKSGGYSGKGVHLLPYILFVLMGSKVHSAARQECVLIRTFYALPTQSNTGRRFGIRQQPYTCIHPVQLHCCHHLPSHAARWVARPMLHAVLEEAE